MKKSYIYLHWILTLLLGPFLVSVQSLVTEKSFSEMIGILEAYPVFLLFSIALSLPTFITYAVCFDWLSNKKASLLVSKLILVTLSIVGIMITFWLLKGSFSKSMAIAYSITALIVGLSLKLNLEGIKKQEQIV